MVMLTAGLVINVCPEEYKLRAAQRGRAGRSAPTGRDGTDRGAGSISAAIVLHKQVETTSCDFIFLFRGYLFTDWQCLSRTARMGNEGGKKKKKSGHRFPFLVFSLALGILPKFCSQLFLTSRPFHALSCMG